MINDIIVDGLVVSFMLYVSIIPSPWALLPGFGVAIIREYFRLKENYEDSLDY